MDDDHLSSQRVLLQPPSCIEFCPVHPSVLVIGTYKLEESQSTDTSEEVPPQSRSGRIEAYAVRKKPLSPDFGVSECRDKFDFPDSAVLDLHFHPRDSAFFAVCTSTSQMVFFRLAVTRRCDAGQGMTELSILKVGSLQLGEDSRILATSFAWNRQPITVNTDYRTDYLSFAATFASGEIKVLSIKRTVKHKPFGQHDFQILSQTRIDPAHTLEAWTVAFADFPRLGQNAKLLLTGGDDSVLAVHSFIDTVDSPSPSPSPSPLLRDRKSHSAGVTAIFPFQALDPSPINPSTIAFITGSYDEHIRVFTIEAKNPYTSQLVAELPLGGGVWRLRKLSESFREEVGEEGMQVQVCGVLILASCMHAGVRILRVRRRQPDWRADEDWSKWEIELVGSFTEGHESMCYGADAVSVERLFRERHVVSGKQGSSNLQIQRDAAGDFVVVSTSFYDRKICVWTFRSEKCADERKGDDLKACAQEPRETDTEQKDGNG